LNTDLKYIDTIKVGVIGYDENTLVETCAGREENNEKNHIYFTRGADFSGCFCGWKKAGKHERQNDP
jgi:hypothetical protein